MANVHMIITLFILFPSLLVFIVDADQNPKENIAEFRVYLQNVLSGPNATVYEVARSNITSTSPTSFGQVAVSDDTLTAGPDPRSQKLGKSYFLAVNAGLTELTFVLTGVFKFTSGPYNGSSLSIMGLKQVPNPNQQLPVVGGTGIFNMARGYTLSNLHSFDSANNIYVWRFDTYVVY